MPAPNAERQQDPIAWLARGVADSYKNMSVEEAKSETSAWITPTLLDPYAAPPAPRRHVQYRYNHRLDKHDFRGHVDAGDAEPATTIFTIIDPFILDYTYDFATHFVTSGTVFVIAHIVVSAVSGNVVAYWTPNT
jgi:hypothetical protein